MSSAQARVATICTHLQPASTAATPCDATGCPVDLQMRGRKALAEMEAAIVAPPRSREGPFKHKRSTSSFKFERGMDPMAHLGQMEDWTQGLSYNIAEHLPGPLRHRERDDVLHEVQRANGAGAAHVMWADMQRRYCKDGMCSNFVIPIIGFRGGAPPVVTQQIILAHPDDCQRIAASHVKKQPNFSAGLLGTGIIATTDNEHWRQQRDSLVQAFHPIASLSQIYPRVVARAEKCADRLFEMSNGGRNDVDISEFLLHEALAQLMLGLFGFPEDFMEAVNKRFRDVMSEKTNDSAFTKPFMYTLLQMVKDPAHVAPGEALASGCPVRGPLSRMIDMTTDDGDSLTKVGNAFIFAFAGHDTTGHTMTWLVFEMCKNRALQTRLQAEVDQFFERLDGRKMTYRDLNGLPFMTRCVMETLRLWPAVANGTFRELEHDDWVTGEGGAKVKVPKGTYVQVTTYLRHRDPALWGPDANVYNPDRSFEGKEVWDEKGFAAYNPATPRFSPFTFQPRDCIGKNFAQSEMRAILANLFHRFDFHLSNPEHAAGQQGVNYGTMGPRDFSRPTPENPTFTDRVPLGLQVRAVPRRR